MQTKLDEADQKVDSLSSAGEVGDCLLSDYDQPVTQKKNKNQGEPFTRQGLIPDSTDLVVPAASYNRFNL